MSLFCQHGFNKGNKITKAIAHRTVSGVVVSAKYEHADSVGNLVRDIKANDQNVQVLFDPQFYVSLLDSPKDFHLPTYPYYEAGVRRVQLSDPAWLEEKVDKCINYQIENGLDLILTPTIQFRNFNDRWSQIALNLGTAAINTHRTGQAHPPLLVSLVTSIDAFSSLPAVEDFLDIISLWECEGFYLVVDISALQKGEAAAAEKLANWMYFIYVLADINDFKVICGFSDFVGLLAHSVGAYACASGWFNTTRYFAMDNFLPRGGGARAKPRYTSAELLGRLKVLPDLATISRVNMLDEVLTQTRYDSRFRKSGISVDAWTPDVECLHHWEVLSRLYLEIERESNVSERLAVVKDKLNAAGRLHKKLAELGIPVKFTEPRRRVFLWNSAIDIFERVIP